MLGVVGRALWRGNGKTVGTLRLQLIASGLEVEPRIVLGRRGAEFHRDLTTDGFQVGGRDDSRHRAHNRRSKPATPAG